MEETKRNETEKMLSALARTAWMGHNTLAQLGDITEHEEFASFLRIQQKSYDMLLHETQLQFLQMGEEPQQDNDWNRMMTAMGIKMDTLRDRSDRHIADMLIQGTNQGILELTKAQKDFPNAETAVQNLTERTLVMLQRGVEELKAFL